MVTYSLSIRAYSITNQYVPIVLIWMCLAIFIHILGAVVLRLRMKLIAENSPGISTALKNEFLLSAHHSEGRLTFRQESYWFILLPWATSVATIIHIAMGTLVLSSLLFIDVHDALFVVSLITCLSYCLKVLLLNLNQVCPFLGPVCVSRVIVMFELSGMRTSIHVDKKYPKVEELQVAYRSSKEHEWEHKSCMVDAYSSP